MRIVKNLSRERVDDTSMHLRGMVSDGEFLNQNGFRCKGLQELQMYCADCARFLSIQTVVVFSKSMEELPSQERESEPDSLNNLTRCTAVESILLLGDGYANVSNSSLLSQKHPNHAIPTPYVLHLSALMLDELCSSSVRETTNTCGIHGLLQASV